MTAFLEFYFFVIVLQFGVPVSMAKHTFSDIKVCRHIYAIVMAEVIPENKKPEVIGSSLVTKIVPGGCARREDGKV